MPSFIGMLNEKHLESDLNNTKESKSSEIVDLDTKEIKTVATNINMDQNSISRKGQNVNSNTVQLLENETTKYSSDQSKKEKTVLTSNDKDSTKGKNDDSIPYEWAIELMKGYVPGIIHNSPKMEIFFCILKESLKLNDRILLFSQSLLTLNLIEKFLQTTQIHGTEYFWTRGKSYFRLDGSTTSQDREKLVSEFNCNPNIKLFLISTRAGSLGINLVGANRVVIFDASWNPCHDTQAVYRIYRYGQQKPCYVYRIVMDRCLEKKIYDRQIKKQGMSDRVVDECNPEAHLTLKDVTNLCHDYDNDDELKKDEIFFETTETFSDEIMDTILEKHKDLLSKQPFHHDSLLVDRKEKKLSQAEKRQAHKGYEMEKKATTKQNFNYSGNKLQYRIVRSDGTVFNRPVASIRPMQASRPNSAIKSTGGSARSTRWIPAEVWQRQGMTAQEMTLPLDVVIPTNSSDKSSIVLKAGQQVMVLKSAKGIYMQLDSGKIIAIRTQNKTSEPEKMQKPEVIDITTEGDSGNDTAQNAKKGFAKNTKTESTIEKESECNTKASDKDNMENNTFEKKTVGNSFSNCKLNKAHLKDALNHESSISVLTSKNSSMAYSENHNNSGSSLFSKSSNDSFLETRNQHVPMEYRTSNPLETVESPITQSLEVNKSWNKSNQDSKTEICPKNINATCTPKHYLHPEITTSVSDQSRHGFKTGKIFLGKKHTNLVPRHDSYRQHGTDDAHTNPMIQESNYSTCGTENNTYGHLLYGYNPHSQTSSIDYTPHHSPKPFGSTIHHSALSTENNHEELSQESSKQQNITHLSNFNTSPSINNPEASASFANTTLSVPEYVQSTSTNVHYPSRELYSNSHPQYYGNVFDPNPISTPTSYSSQFGEYSAYGNYTHSPYRPPFNGNVQNPSSASVGSTTYMPWTFMASNAINEPCNTVYSTSYAQNSTHQYNQWHNQR